MELWGHSNNHVIEVGVEITTFWHVETKWRIIVVACQQVVGIVRETGRHLTDLGELWRPDAQVGTLRFVHSLVWRPNSVMDDALAIVPLLEEVTAMLLVGRVKSRQELHEFSQLLLLETLVHEEVIFLMHSAVAALARSRKYFEASPQSITVTNDC